MTFVYSHFDQTKDISNYNCVVPNSIINLGKVKLPSPDKLRIMKSLKEVFLSILWGKLGGSTSNLLPAIVSYLEIGELLNLCKSSRGFLTLSRQQFFKELRFQKFLEGDSFVKYYKFIIPLEMMFRKVFPRTPFQCHAVTDFQKFFLLLNQDMVALSLATLKVNENDLTILSIRCTKLRRLDLSMCPHISDKSLEKICRQFKELRCVNFYGCPNVTMESVEMFKNRYPLIKHHFSDRSPEEASQAFQVESEGARILLEHPQECDFESLKIIQQISLKKLLDIRKKLGMMNMASDSEK